MDNNKRNFKLSLRLNNKLIKSFIIEFIKDNEEWTFNKNTMTPSNINIIANSLLSNTEELQSEYDKNPRTRKRNDKIQTFTLTQSVKNCINDNIGKLKAPYIENSKRNKMSKLNTASCTIGNKNSKIKLYISKITDTEVTIPNYKINTSLDPDKFKDIISSGDFYVYKKKLYTFDNNEHISSISNQSIFSEINTTTHSSSHFNSHSTNHSTSIPLNTQSNNSITTTSTSTNINENYNLLLDSEKAILWFIEEEISTLFYTKKITKETQIGFLNNFIYNLKNINLDSNFTNNRYFNNYKFKFDYEKKIIDELLLVHLVNLKIQMKNINPNKLIKSLEKTIEIIKNKNPTTETPFKMSSYTSDDGIFPPFTDFGSSDDYN